jgi:hypothetical protein
MLSFIRKRFPSKDRKDEHIKSNKVLIIEVLMRIYFVYSSKVDDHRNRSQSNDEWSVNNDQKKNTRKSSSTLNELDTSSPSIQNQSYSYVDYFPMMPRTLSQSNNQNKTISNRGKHIFKKVFLL